MTEQERFDRSLREVLRHEGGWVKHPKDPGGETNLGVTKRTLEAWLKRPVTSATMKALTVKDVAPIYRDAYWLAASCDELPAGVDYIVFDLAVNSGVSRASKFLQECAHVTIDGKIGPMTLAAVRKVPAAEMVLRLRNKREAFYRGLGTFSTFGRGWLRRLSEVSSLADQWARAK